MKTRTFGKTGWEVSEIGFGAWALGGQWGDQDDQVSLRALEKSLECGINFIDTAQVYGDGRSEKVIGDIFKGRQDKIYVATKIPPNDKGEWPPHVHENCEERYPKDYLIKGVEESLSRLGVESIDLLQLHTWTRAWNKNPVALNTLQELKKQGKIKAIGISTPEQDQNSLIELMENGLLDSVQVIYNIFEQEPAAEFLQSAKENGVGVIVRCVFDEGALTGKFHSETQFGKGDFRAAYFKGDRLADVVKRVDAIKKDLGEEKLASTAVRFALNHPAVSTVITGIRTPEQAEMNCGFSDLPSLDQDTMKKLYGHAWRRYYWDF